jgi:hypothetical protein
MSDHPLFLPIWGIATRLGWTSRDHKTELPIRVLQSLSPERGANLEWQKREEVVSRAQAPAKPVEKSEFREPERKFTEFLSKEYSTTTPTQRALLAQLAAEFLQRIEEETPGTIKR